MRMDDISLIALLPRFMREDETAQALCKAIEGELQGVNENALEFLYSLLIDNAPEWFLDEMAWEMNINWYDIDADIEAKRNIIHNAPWIKHHLGTKAAVETTVADYFGTAVIEEWFEFDGDPFYFRVFTSPSLSEETAYRFMKAVNHTKNVRSHLKEIITIMTAHHPLYAAQTTAEAELQRLTIHGLEGQHNFISIAFSEYEHQCMEIPGLE